jgi:hypothetical protein
VVGVSEPAIIAGSPPPATIPVTEMLLLYRLLRRMRQKDRLAMARWLAREPQVLASMFTRSVRAFAKYENLERFHGDRSTRVGPAGGLSTGRHLLEHLCNEAPADGHWPIVGAPRLNFTLVDYEVEVTRTTGGARFEDGTPATAGLTMDLLLRAMDGAPIVCEVKVGTEKKDDTDPFFALVQALASAAHLVTDSQLSRLKDSYPKLASKGGPIDVYVLFVKPTKKRKSLYQDDFCSTARELADGLIRMPEISRHVRHLALIGARLEDNRLVFTHRDEPS